MHWVRHLPLPLWPFLLYHKKSIKDFCFEVENLWMHVP